MEKGYGTLTKRFREEKKISFSMSEEVSLSVDETNALRKSLGMTPLLIDSKSSSDGVKLLPFYVAEETMQKPAKKSEVDEGRRLLESLSAGGGILDFLNDPDMSMGAKRPRSENSDEDASDSGSSNSFSSD